MTRFDRLHRPARVRLAQKIYDLARNEETSTGKPILYMRQYDIALALGEYTQNVTLALRLSYTGEFKQLYGWGFVPPGNGRSGGRHGYVLEHGLNQNANFEIAANVDDNSRKNLDHLKGIAEHERGLGTKKGRKIATVVDGAAIAIEAILGP